MKKWIDVKELGELYLEIVLVRFDIPLLFVCVDKDKSRYLVLCVDEELGQYIIAKSSNKVLLAMLNNKISMDLAFKDSMDGKLVAVEYDVKKMNFNYKHYSADEITRDMLPDEGAFFELKNKKIEDYIAKLRDEIDLIYKITIKSLCENIQSYTIYQFDNQTEHEECNQYSPQKSKNLYQLYWMNDKVIKGVRQYSNGLDEEINYNYIISNTICKEEVYAI